MESFEVFAVHASKDGDAVETEFTDPTLTVARANSLQNQDGTSMSPIISAADMGRADLTNPFARLSTANQFLVRCGWGMLTEFYQNMIATDRRSGLC